MEILKKVLLLPWVLLKWAWNIIRQVWRFIRHPSELKEALTDERTQAVYHLSSANTTAGMFGWWLAWPEGARIIAATAKTWMGKAWVHLTTWFGKAFLFMTEGPGGVWIKQMVAGIREVLTS